VVVVAFEFHMLNCVEEPSERMLYLSPVVDLVFIAYVEVVESSRVEPSQFVAPPPTEFVKTPLT
jgi:hypothetical protein